MASEQIAVRLSEDLLERMDDLVQSGIYASRAAVVRAGVEAVAEAEERRRVDRAIVDGYTRIPPAPSDGAAAVESLRAAIVEEPW